nr:histone-lysine N-methyltransferase 2C-like [Gorilla gorilla gorilla]
MEKYRNEHKFLFQVISIFRLVQGIAECGCLEEAWSTHNTVSPPSWSPDISEGREIFKPRQLPGSAIWSIKVGRGSGFPGKRRPRGAGLSGRGGRGRSKLKSGIGAVVLPGVSTADISSNKDDEENSMHTTVVLFSSSDKFTLNQDMCVVCGSFGQGAEGRLLACSQCGQCYHPYCVSIKKENLWIVMENQNLVLSGKLWMMKLREWKEQMVSKREKGNHTDQVLVDLWCGKEVELGKGKPKDL